MKYVLVIPDGAADEPQESLGSLTPFQAAKTPNMDAVVQAGVVGRANHVPDSMPSGSDVGTMSLFGYDPLKFHTGRAPLEAAAQGIELGANDWAIRCNLVTIMNGVMQSFTAGQVPNDVGANLVKLLQKDQCGSENWKFYTGVSYRNLLLYRSRNGDAPFSTDTQSTPPHDITDQDVAPFLPSGPGSDQLLELMQRSVPLFASDEANAARGRNAATQTWLWGIGKRPALTPFQERFGVHSAVITAVDLLRGIGRLLGWDVVEVAGATGYLDTDYAAKGRAGIEALKDHDFVVVHVEASDEASHEGDAAAKVEALERIDADIVGPLHAFLKSQGDYRLLLSPDHPTFLRTKTHAHGYVPVGVCGTGIAADAATTYDDISAAESDLVFEQGCDLMPWFLQCNS
ncbi:MAG: cofactor-independent phosphoglycerate mutase [Planctomycetota bacterium]|nr:cofactor-independent phosphoglycerate mutase [Planctomycetota bacterium]